MKAILKLFLSVIKLIVCRKRLCMPQKPIFMLILSMAIIKSMIICMYTNLTLYNNRLSKNVNII